METAQEYIDVKISKKSKARQLLTQEQIELYNKVLEIAPQYKKAKGIDRYFENGEGSNVPYLILINKELYKQGKRTPTFDEAMQLDKMGKLSNDVYRDFGIVIYNENEPNADLGKMLISYTKKRKWEFPILVNPWNLDINKKTGEYLFSKNDSLIIHGEEAIEELKKFKYAGNSGIQRLGRGRIGDWYAGWGYLFNSDSGGRVDWVVEI